MAEAASPSRAARWSIVALSVVLALFGALLAGGGAWLLMLGGSPYYVLAGLVLIATAFLLYRRRPAAVWLYWAVFLATLVWAVWEAGLDGWALLPRVFAPGLLLVLVSLAAFAFWPKRRAGALTAVAVVLVVGFFAFAGLTGNENETPPRAGLLGTPLANTVTAASPGSGIPPVGEDWPAYAATYEARSHSPLAQITPENVSRLERVWTYETGDMPSGKDVPYSPETTPIKVGEHLYLCSAKNVLIALDAATGRERWRHDPVVSDDAIPHAAACRGVAYYRAPQLPPDAPCAERIIEGTLDGRLIAVDARLGQPCPGFGLGGEVNLREGLGDHAPGQYAVTSPPPIIRGVIVVGAQVLDGERRMAPSGVIRGYDAVTGELRWAWDMMQPGRTGPPPPGEIYTRGTPNMWTIASGDEALGLVYLPMGNAAVDYYGATRRPPENYYASSLVALDVTTGRPAWRFQTVHYDVWDYDLGSQGTLTDFLTPNGTVPALVLPSKQGELYVLDRRTGRPLTPVVERAVPIGGVEPQNLSRTQPFSRWHTLRKPDLRERDMWGATPLDQLWCRIQFRRSNYRGIYTPPSVDRPWIQYPGYNGGSDWGGIAIDPRRGVMIANYNDMPNHNRLLRREEVDKLGWAPLDLPGGGREGDPQFGVPYGIKVNAGWRLPTKLLCKEPPYGGIRAVDLRTGRTVWDRPFGDARRNGLFNIPSGLPIRIGTPNNGGPITTAGGLIFIAATTDNMFRAIDIRTGEVLWQDRLPAGGQATPLTYSVGGRQFVVVTGMGHSFMETGADDDVLAYSLPGPGA